MNETMLNFEQDMRAHLGELEGATAQLAANGSDSQYTEAALSAARNAMATIEAFLQSKTAEK